MYTPLLPSVEKTERTLHAHATHGRTTGLLLLLSLLLLTSSISSPGFVAQIVLVALLLMFVFDVCPAEFAPTSIPNEWQNEAHEIGVEFELELEFELEADVLLSSF